MGLAGPSSSGDSARWRVFISHTSELRDFPRGRSYVAAAEQAISAAGHVSVDMSGFPAADQPSAQVCAERVRGCDVYLGVLGTRYGSPVRDKPEVSYTELEFDTATEAGLDRLVFLLDTEADDVGIPLSQTIDREFGTRQDAFRRRVQTSKLTTRSFADPAELGQLVERSLRELADTRRRIGSGIQQERIPAEPEPVRVSKFVNPPPTVAPTWFQDRRVETGLLAKFLADPGIRMVTVTGRAGIGKTTMVCRLLKELEAGRIPDVEGDAAPIVVGGIAYLSSNGVHRVNYPTLVTDLLRLVPAETAQRLQRAYQDPHYSPGAMMLAVLEAFPVGEPVVVLLDNLEAVMDTEEESLAEQALAEALTAVLTAPAHAVTMIATTRVKPTELVKVEPARQRQLRLDQGLSSPDAETVLRELDDDGHLGLRDAPDELLDGLRRHTRGFPRALEAVKAILEGDETLTPRDLLDHTRQLPEDRVAQVLVGEAYDLLDAPAQQVMQALAVHPAPVSAVGVDFLLRPVNPTTDAAPILTRLVRRQLARFQDQRYYLHPLDREYARGQLPRGLPGDSPAAFTLTGLQARAADYYARIRTPRESWRSLEDVRPQMAEFELRCDVADYDTAATVLQSIDASHLQVWGHYRTVVELHGRIHGRITDPTLNAAHLAKAASCYQHLGDYRAAIDLLTQAIALARGTGNRYIEDATLGRLGNCHFCLGHYRQAIDLFRQALAIARDTGNRHGEDTALCNLGLCHQQLGDYRQAIDLFRQALAIARDTGNRHGEDTALCNLGLCHQHLGGYRQAIDLLTQALDLARDTGNSSIQSAALGNLGLCHFSLGDYEQALDLFRQALAIARDTGARQVEGGALGCLGLCYQHLGDYREAVDLLTQALAIARDIGYPYGEACALDNLGRTHLTSGDARQAMTLFEQALSIAEASHDIEPVIKARSGLARACLQMGDPTAALTATAMKQALSYPTEEPALRVFEGLALLQLDRLEESERTFSSAIAAADALLDLADRNVAALQARALALSGLAAISGRPDRATQAEEAFTQACAVTRAQGVTETTRLLLDEIARYDRSDVLTGVCATLDTQ